MFSVLIYKRKNYIKMEELKNYFSYKDFLKESKKESGTPLTLFKKDVKHLLDQMFASVKKPKYTFDKDGYPTHVEFQIEENDYKLEYKEELVNEFTAGVLKKRDTEPILKFDKKNKEGEKGSETYHICFTIKNEKIDPKRKEDEEIPRHLNFDKDSSEQLKKKLKSDKYTSDQKIEIKEILDELGVKVKEDDDDDNYISDEDADEEAKKEAKKKK